jgi:hypothetical protein
MPPDKGKRLIALFVCFLLERCGTFRGSLPCHEVIASSANGQPLAADGFARLAVPGDQAMGRFVSNLTELQVVNIGA